MRPGLYNDNRERAYPFVFNENSSLPTQAIVDFGCIVGDAANFAEGDYVYLHAITRSSDGDTLEFDFRCTAPGLVGRSMTFTRQTDADIYTTEFVELSTGLLYEDQLEDLAALEEDEVEEDILVSSLEVPSCIENDIAWEGFLVTGDFTALLDLIAPGDILNLTDSCMVEAAAVQNLYSSRLRSINIANKDRVRATAADGCKEACLPFDEQDSYVVEQCLTGSVRFAPGYNMAIRQNTTGLVFSAGVGAGLGEPCEEVPLFPGEDAVGLLSGGSACNEVLRSFNGMGGRIFTIEAGVGSRVIPDADLNRIIIALDMNGLAVCYDSSDSSDPYEELDYSSDSCDCGPE
jgi:hypothetical protein